MIFSKQFITSLEILGGDASDIVFAGVPVDDRGSQVTQSLKNTNSLKYVELCFNPERMSFSVDQVEVNLRGFEDFLNQTFNDIKIETLTIDATTLSIAELLYIFRWVKKLQKEITLKIIYAEPENYTSRIDTQSDFGKHQFSLSDDSRGYIALPGFTRAVNGRNKSHVIALLGFERVRLGQLLSNDEGAYIKSFTPIFGVPGFKPYYDKHSVYQNIDLITRNGEKPEFSSANNPFATYNLLSEISESLPELSINIAPIGTKPMAIGACLYLVNNSIKAGLMYDHPYKKQGRSKGVSKVHCFVVDM